MPKIEGDLREGIAMEIVCTDCPSRCNMRMFERGHYSGGHVAQWVLNSRKCSKRLPDKQGRDIKGRFVRVG